MSSSAIPTSTLSNLRLNKSPPPPPSPLCNSVHGPPAATQESRAWRPRLQIKSLLHHHLLSSSTLATVHCSLSPRPCIQPTLSSLEISPPGVPCTCSSDAGARRCRGPPQSLHCLLRWCSQMLPPPQSRGAELLGLRLLLLLCSESCAVASLRALPERRSPPASLPRPDSECLPPSQ